MRPHSFVRMTRKDEPLDLIFLTMTCENCGLSFKDSLSFDSSAESIGFIWVILDIKSAKIGGGDCDEFVVQGVIEE